MNDKNIIELNGKRYNALTGEMLGPATILHNVAVPKAAVAPVSRSLDGFSMPSSAPKADIRPPRPATTHHQPHVGSHAQAHRPQSPQTLMRHAVQKPGPGFKTQVNVQQELAARPVTAIVPKTSVQSVSPARLQRAQTTFKSPQINRYGQPLQSVAPVVAPLEVRQAPSPQQPATNKPLDVFEKAVANAGNFVDTTAQKISFKKRLRRHALSMTAGALVLVVLGGFLAYQNLPGIQLKVASLKAGVPTHMPDFAAAGFSFNHVIQHQPNQLTIGFSGHGATYQIIEQPTNWAGDEMIQNVSSTDASGKPNYKTLQAGSTVVYRIDGNGAAWVSGGKWYQVNGTGTLTDAQLKALVSHI